MVQKVVYIIGKYRFISVWFFLLGYVTSLYRNEGQSRPENPGLTKNQQDDGMFVFIRIMKIISE
jgi:hypothetical protein